MRGLATASRREAFRADVLLLLERAMTAAREGHDFIDVEASPFRGKACFEVSARQVLDFFAYLRDVLARIGSTPVSQLEPFLLDRWRQDAQTTAKT